MTGRRSAGQRRGRVARAAGVLAVALALSSVGIGPGWTAEVPGLTRLGDGGGEVNIEAAQIDYDQQTNVVTAIGAVKITRGAMVLTADRVSIDRDTRVASAEGNVVLTDPEGTLSADALTLDLIEETGRLDRGTVQISENNYRITGERFEKFPGQSYEIDDGSLTTCRCPEGQPPSWSIRGERITLDLEGYCWVRGGVFAVADVPVFYLPVGVFPVKRERQTGLLTPRLGFSNRRGVQITQPLFIDITKSMDATLTLDVETSARIGLLSEYRYALSLDTRGEIHGSYFNEAIRRSESVANKEIADPDIPRDRWSAGMTHDQWLPWGVRGFADVFRVSDDLFLREINVFTFNPGVDVALRTRRFERSRVGVRRQFDRGEVFGVATWYQEFINPDDFVFQTPPRLEGFSSHRFLDDRVMLHLRGEGVNFTRDEGFDGQRLDLAPEVEIPWRVGNYAYGSWRGGFRSTLYRLDDEGVPDPDDVRINGADPGSPPPSILPELGGDASREVFYLGGEVRTALSRVMPVERFGIQRVKHTIEPVVGYLFVPRTDTRQAELPLYDAVDRVNHRNVFTYGVTSRLLARMRAAGDDPERDGGGAIRELGRLSLLQSYDTVTKGGDFIEVDQATGEVRRRDHISDLTAHLRLTPVPFFAFEGRTDYSVTGEGAKGVKVGVLLSDPDRTPLLDRAAEWLWSRPPGPDFALPELRGGSQLGIGYRFTANSAVEEINAGVLLRLSKRFSAAYETRYDNVGGGFLENRVGLRMISDCECWVIDVGVTDKVNPDETEVRVLVSLVGLGQFGQEPFRGAGGALGTPSLGLLDE